MSKECEVLRGCHNNSTYSLAFHNPLGLASRPQSLIIKTKKYEINMCLDAIGIISTDPQKSIQFYKLLGIHIEAVGGTEHFEGKTVSGIRIMIDSVTLIKKLNPDWKKSSGVGIVLCFKQNSPQEVDDLFVRVTTAGFKSVKTPWDAFWGQRYASVQDPDGNQIDLFAEL